MLASLKIKDIAIIDELDIKFCPHLNIITGVTARYISNKWANLFTHLAVII